MNTRIIFRSIVLDPDTHKLLLVRNKGQNFWYPPGGEWEKGEDVFQCLIREAKEETGIDIKPIRFLFVQTFSPSEEQTDLELFWLANPTSIEIPVGHIDFGGIVEESRWLSKEEMNSLKVFPKRLSRQFWDDINIISSIPDQFIK